MKYKYLKLAGSVMSAIMFFSSLGMPVNAADTDWTKDVKTELSRIQNATSAQLGSKGAIKYIDAHKNEDIYIASKDISMIKASLKGSSSALSDAVSAEYLERTAADNKTMSDLTSQYESVIGGKDYLKFNYGESVSEVLAKLGSDVVSTKKLFAETISHTAIDTDNGKVDVDVPTLSDASFSTIAENTQKAIDKALEKGYHSVKEGEEIDIINGVDIVITAHFCSNNNNDPVTRTFTSFDAYKEFCEEASPTTSLNDGGCYNSPVYKAHKHKGSSVKVDNIGVSLQVLNSSAGTYDTGQSLFETCYTNVKFTKHVHTKDCPKGSRYCPGTASTHFEEPDGNCPGGGFDPETGEPCTCGHCKGWYQCTECGHSSHKGSACPECAKIEAGYTCDKRLNSGGVTVLGCGKTEGVRYADEGVEYYQKNCGHYNGEILNIEVTYTKEESHG